MEENNKKVEKTLAEKLNAYSGSMTGPSFFAEIGKALKPIIDKMHENYNAQIKSKQKYKLDMDNYLNQFKTPEEKVLAIQNTISQLDRQISSEKIRDYTGNVKYFTALRNDILLPIKI